MKAANDNVPSILDEMISPDEIASRISASSGLPITARAVWEKARRIGVSRKIGRLMLISANDIPALLQEEKQQWPKSSSVEKSTTTTTPMGRASNGDEALALLQKSRRKRKLTSLSRE